ncbi:MAG TPA: MFS transporter [Falsiroseomonas sp.]|jgi:MFS family permease|nr:MFS transporter [Falsiroseomonas sp.]
MRAPWIAPLAAALLMQTVGSFMNQVVPVVAPRMTADLGLPAAMVGNFSSLTILGSIVFLLFGTPLVAAFGPARLLQCGVLTGASALALAALGEIWLLPVAALLLGIGYGPSGPAGSRILQATAPPRHRVLIFSIKQAGAPAGGALAGVVAAQVAAQWGWQPALLTGMVLATGAALIIQPMRAQLDAERNPRFRIREAFTLRRLAAPVTTLRLHPVLPPLTLQAFAFAALQGSLFSFTVTWLVEAHGFTLIAAGTVFATMQVAGVVGRLVLGWAADRLGDAVRSLTIHGLCAAGLAVLFVLAAPAAPWPVALGLALLCGFTSASWNGIFLAEVARVSPADRVAEASAGAIMLCFLGYLSAPSAFALAVMTTGSWTLPFLGAAGLLAAVSLFVLAWRAARGGAAR